MADTNQKSKPRELSILERRRVCPARFYCNALQLTGGSGPLCPCCDRVAAELHRSSGVHARARRLEPLDLLEDEDGPFYGC